VKLPLSLGCSAFGADPENYALARPPYPDSLYSCLVWRCGLGLDSAVFEVGPGTGLATASLLARGANPLHAIEADPRLADYLRKDLPHGSFHIHNPPLKKFSFPKSRSTSELPPLRSTG
jgi:16S rRNA A1518/A1519 N6-dimethyltransferase RsmA/KsgA/DIM1 with predicted DNA glycosylase/AP lyase activity